MCKYDPILSLISIRFPLQERQVVYVSRIALEVVYIDVFHTLIEWQYTTISLTLLPEGIQYAILIESNADAI